MTSDRLMNNDIVITMLGGCVTGVFTDIPNTEVVLIDWDNINESSSETSSAGRVRGWPIPIRLMADDTQEVYKNSITKSLPV